MKIFISGGTGFVGKHLSNLLLDKGHEVLATGTRANPKGISHKNFHHIQADTTQKGRWQESVKDADAIVNLAGKSIFSLWTKACKKQIYDSRVLTTRHLVESLPEHKAVTFCTTSAAGYYGNRGDDVLTEDEPNGNDFLARVCRDWEAAAFQAEKKGARVVAMRFGVVLGKHGGAMKQMLPVFRCFLGGPLASGRQWFPWIHLEDLLDGILFALEDQEIKGPVNFTSPNSVRNREFAKTLGQVLTRPAVMPAPGFMMRLMLGEFGASLLASQRAVPGVLSGHDFQFRHPHLREALENIVER